MSFRQFYRELWGWDPFPWQERLATQVLEDKWPTTIALPTAAGKTSLIDIAVYALGIGVPGAARRIFFVVDRRVIVDEADARAACLAKKLREAKNGSVHEIAEGLRRAGGEQRDPLVTGKLRGGVQRDDAWSHSPVQPAVICSTVDQVGSALLFRSYGTGRMSRSIRAGLTAFDSLIILDEAHTSQPFAQTLGWLKHYRGWTEEKLDLPFTVVEMSATPRPEVADQAFRETNDDFENDLLRSRWTSEKRASLVIETGGESTPEESRMKLAARLAQEAEALHEHRGATVVGVIANRVNTARQTHSILERRFPERAILLTGRSRPYDRDRIWEEYKADIQLGRARNPDRPIFVVATQCVEVGANLDFDGLVTEAASLDALEQRFGRLNRDGRLNVAFASIVALKEQTLARVSDPIYGEALSLTWKWLEGRQAESERVVEIPAEGRKKAKTRKVKDRFVPMGVTKLREDISATEHIDSLLMPSREAPVLMPAHMDLFVQTAPEPAVSPEPAVFLHGPETGPADVQVVWRGDLQPDAPDGHWVTLAAACPPKAAESLPLPIWTLRKWLSGKPADASDVEGMTSDPDRENGDRRVLIWDDDEAAVEKSANVRPGMTVLVPASYGGCDKWGWSPASGNEVEDIGDQVSLMMGRPVLRLDSKLAQKGGYEKLAANLRECDSIVRAREIMQNLGPEEVPPWVKETASRLAAVPMALIPHPDEEILVAVAAKGFLRQSGFASSFSRKVALDEHLEGCGRVAERFAAHLSERVRATIALAAQLHDIGKADPRFQTWLNGGVLLPDTTLLAKSEKSAQNRAAVDRAREKAGYPKGGRHELMSVALLADQAKNFPSVDFELLLHLVGSHHGHCRPFAPVVVDRQPVQVQFNEWSGFSNHGLERAGSGVSERFWRLNRQFGWYGLAYLEALLRLADHRQSEIEGREKEDELSV